MKRIKPINFPLFNCYKNLVGDLKIPSKFIVPSNDKWPSEFHGIKLGAYFRKVISNAINDPKYYLPEENKKLIEMEIVAQFTKQQDVVIRGVNEFILQHGHGDVGASFKFKNDDHVVDEELRGFELGAVLEHIRHRGDFPDIHKELVTRGVDLKPRSNGRDFFRTFDALASYKEIFGHLKIPRDFIVPKDDVRFPKNTWGLKLGRLLDSIRLQGRWSAHKAQLELLGVTFDKKSVKKTDINTLILALQSYKNIHDDVSKIPQKFTVPYDDTKYPEGTWGINLGTIVNNIRCRNSFPEHRGQLEALGVQFKHPATVTFPIIFSALQSYKNTHNSSLLVPKSFTVPKGNTNYAENTWGLKLGAIVCQIVNQNAWSTHRDKFVELGIVYKTKKRNK